MGVLKAGLLLAGHSQSFSMAQSLYLAVSIDATFIASKTGVSVFWLCQTHGMCSTAVYQQRSKYGDIAAALMSEIKYL